MTQTETFSCARDLVFWESQLETVDDPDGLIRARVESHRVALAAVDGAETAISQARETAAALAAEEAEHTDVVERRKVAAMMARAELLPVGTLHPHIVATVAMQEVELVAA